MEEFVKLETLEVTRYYQKDYVLIFLDIENYGDKKKIFIGSDLIPSDRGTVAPMMGFLEINKTQFCLLDMPNEMALEAAEHVYGMFREKYIFSYLYEGHQLEEDWFMGIDKDDFIKVMVTRYKYKEFLIDFSSFRNPEKEEEMITYVYIQQGDLDCKVFCDYFNYRLSDAECEEALKMYIWEYIADFYCEKTNRIYEVEGHWRDEEETEDISQEDMAIDELDESTLMLDEELPFN